MTKGNLSFLLIFISISFLSCSSENEFEDIEVDNFIDTYRDSLIIAHWNIGHFSNGKSFNTTITSENYSEKQIQYKNALDSFKADIIGVCEYNPEFDNDGNLAQDAIFYNYVNANIGPKYQYNCNAIFSKDIPLYNERDIKFTFSVQPRYMQNVDIKVNGTIIRIIETHLDWDQGESGNAFRKEQINEIIENIKDIEHVIILGDFNISDISEYAAFKETGFNLANCGNFGVFNTCPTSFPQIPLDNIIVKGIEISNVIVYRFPDLSDHCALKCTARI